MVIAAARLSPKYSRILNAAPQSDNVDHNGQLGLVCDASEPGSCCAGVQDRDSHCRVVVWCGLTSQRFLCRTTLIIFSCQIKTLLTHTTPHNNTTISTHGGVHLAAVRGGCGRLGGGGGGGEQRRKPPRPRLALAPFLPSTVPMRLRSQPPCADFGHTCALAALSGTGAWRSGLPAGALMRTCPPAAIAAMCGSALRQCSTEL